MRQRGESTRLLEVMRENETLATRIRALEHSLRYVLELTYTRIHTLCMPSHCHTHTNSLADTHIHTHTHSLYALTLSHNTLYMPSHCHTHAYTHSVCSHTITHTLCMPSQYHTHIHTHSHTRHTLPPSDSPSFFHPLSSPSSALADRAVLSAIEAEENNYNNAKDKDKDSFDPEHRNVLEDGEGGHSHGRRGGSGGGVDEGKEKEKQWLVELKEVKARLVNAQFDLKGLYPRLITPITLTPTLYGADGVRGCLVMGEGHTHSVIF